jgi:N4-gp56 family major capsid protein
MSSKLKNQGYEGKALSDQSLVDAFDPERFAELVQSAVRANTVMRDVAMQVNRELVNSPGSSIKIRQTGRVAVNDKSEGSATSTEQWSHDAVEITCDTVKQSYVEFSDESLEDSNLNELQRTAENIGLSMAEENDQDAYDTVTGGTAAADGAAPTSSQVFMDVVGTDGKISYSDVKDLVMRMNQSKYNADSLVVSFDHLGDLLDEDKFIHANKAGTTTGLREGMVGRFAGVEVYVTSQANGSTTGNDDIQAVVLDSTRAFAEAVKRPPRIELDRDVPAGTERVVGTMRYGHSIVDPNAIGYLQNSGA